MRIIAGWFIKIREETSGVRTSLGPWGIVAFQLRFSFTDEYRLLRCRSPETESPAVSLIVAKTEMEGQVRR